MTETCRICEASSGVKNIFDVENKHILKKLAACADVELSASDDLPKHICTECESNLCFAYGFKIQVEYTDRKLRMAEQKPPIKPIQTDETVEEEYESSVYELEVDVESADMIQEEANSECEDVEYYESEFVTNNEGEMIYDQLSRVEYAVLGKEENEEAETEHESHNIQELEHETETFAGNLLEQIKEENDNSHENEMLEAEFQSNFDPEHDPGPDDIEELAILDSEVNGSHNFRNENSIGTCENSSQGENFDENENKEGNESETQSNGKAFRCDTCGVKFKRYVEFNEHKKSHGDKRYQCPTCLKWFSKRYRLKNHRKIHEDEREYPCMLCDKKYTNQGNLERHVRHFHKQVRPYMCNECGLTFTRSNVLKQHSAIHISERTIPCDECGKKFKTEYYLAVHKRSHIPIELRRKRSRETGKKTSPQNPCTCPYCGKVSNSIVLHKNHIRTHTGEKPFECKVCGKKFSFQQSLRTHLLLHTGEKPFKCDICDASFRQIGHLKGHKLIHSGVKQHQCKFCQKSFALKSNLTVHERLHTGETPYTCTICNKKFSDPTACKKHKLGHKEEQVVEDENIEGFSVYLDEDGTELAEIIEMQPELDGKAVDENNYVICEYTET